MTASQSPQAVEDHPVPQDAATLITMSSLPYLLDRLRTESSPVADVGDITAIGYRLPAALVISSAISLSSALVPAGPVRVLGPCR